MSVICYLSYAVLLGAISFQTCCGKPLELLLDTLNPAESEISESTQPENDRAARSPQFGLIGGDYDYSDYEDDSRHFKLGHKSKHHKFPHKPLGLVGGHGCRGYGCGGYPDHGGYFEHHQGGQSGSFATASAGSGGAFNSGHSEANAQSASFSFGPYTATFSVAQSSSHNQHY